MDGELGTIFSKPDAGQTDGKGQREFIIISKAGSKGSIYYTKRYNPAFRKPKPIVPTADIKSYQELVAELRLARLGAKLTQFQVAKEIGSSQAAVSRFEQGKTNPTVTFLYTYTKAINHDVVFGTSKNP